MRGLSNGVFSLVCVANGVFDFAGVSDCVFSFIGVANGVFGFVGVANGVFSFVGVANGVWLSWCGKWCDIGLSGCVGWNLGACLFKSARYVLLCAELKDTTRWIGISCGKKKREHACLT